MNAAGNGCDPVCSSGVVNVAKNGCDAVCSTGAMNAAGNGCEDPSATYSPPGTFADAGSFTPASDDGSGGGGGAVAVVMLLLVCCCLLGGMVYLREKNQGPFKDGGALAAYGKDGSKMSKQNNVEMTDVLPPGWIETLDEQSGFPLYTNEMTGAVQWEKPAMSSQTNPMNRASHGRNETQLPSGWGKDMDGEGNKYYYDNTGNVSWEAPPGSVGGSAGGGGGGSQMLAESHVRSDTQLPEGWGKDHDADGNKYYYDEGGQVSWEAPPGATGGSTGL